ncbi:hypothetical protein AAC387_Pa09g2007 [Persea americana]
MTLLLTVFLLLLSYFLFKSIYTFIWRPLKVQLHFQRQGLCGPPRHLINENAKEARELIARAQSEPLPLSHDCVSRVIPQYCHWSKQNGKTFLYWFGSAL